MHETQIKYSSLSSLFPEQLLLVLLLTILLLAGIDWELPAHERYALLQNGYVLSEQDRRLLQSVSESHYQKLDHVEKEQVQKLLTASEKNEPAEKNERSWFFSVEQQIAKYRAFINGSGAVDERKGFSALARINPSAFDFDPKRYIYGGSYLYPLGAVLFLLETSGLLVITNDIAAYLEHPYDMAALYIAGRMFSVLSFAGALWVLGLLGNRLQGRITGFGAMAVFGLSTLILNYAVTTKPHIYAAFFGLLAVYFLIRYNEEQKQRCLLVSAAAAGWAFGASFAAGALALLYPFLLFQRRKLQPGIKQVLAAWIIMLLVFLATNPFVVFSWDRFLLNLNIHSGSQGYGYGVADLRKLFIYWLKIVNKGYCFPVSVLGLAGLSLAILREHAWRQRLAIVTVVLLCLLGMTLGNMRISIFAGALFSLFIGYGWNGFIRAVPFAPAWRGAAAGVLFVPSLFFAGLFFRDIIWDKHWVAPTRDWIKRTAFDKTKTIGVLDGPTPVHMPPFPFWQSQLVDLTAFSGKEEPPDYVIVGNYDKEKQYWQRHPLRAYYVLDAVLGYRPSYDWLLKWRVRSQSRISAWAYRRASNK